MSKQTRDIWCDHCEYRFATQVHGAEVVVTCPNCAEPSVVVTCATCENQSEVAHVNYKKGTWVCPQCKEYRDFSAETLTDLLASQIAIEASESIRPRMPRPSLRLGCTALFILYILATVLLNSCRDSQPRYYQTSYSEPIVEVFVQSPSIIRATTSKTCPKLAAG